MSWDVLLLKSKIDTTDMDAQPESMGDKEVLIQEFKKVSSDIDFGDKSWGIYFDGQTSIEINIGGNTKVDTIMLHIRGNGDPFSFIKATCDYFKWYALDCSTGQYIDFSSQSTDSWDRWQKFRDKIRNG
jgi:hypothetical protein